MNFTRGQCRSVIKTVVLVTVVAMAFQFFLQNSGVMTVCAGVCLFLFAMLLLEQSFKLLSAGVLDNFLNKVADKNWKSFAFGFTLSTLVQSSGLVTVIAVSFLSAGLISLAAGVAMVYGVNLSAACTTWIVGYFGLKAKISLYAMPFIIFGVAFYLNKNRKIKGAGLFMLSLGLLFLGISWMKDGFDSFKDTLDISSYALPGMKGLLLNTLIGLLITAITQSSHATITLAITALTVGQIDYMTAVGISIGAAVGSTIFTVIGSLNANIEGKKIAVSHVAFKLICAAFAIPLIDQYLALTDYLAPILGIRDDDYVYKLAIIMSLFNLWGVVLLTPFISQMCKALNRFVRTKNTDGQIDTPQYLNDESLRWAGSALRTLHQETEHLLNNTLDIVSRMIQIDPKEIFSDEHAHDLVAKSVSPKEEDFDELYKCKFKPLYSEIIQYAVKATSAAGMNDELASQLMEIRRANIILAAAVKKAQLLNANIMNYGFSSNDDVREQYAHIRRNLVRLIRFVYELKGAKTTEEKAQMAVRLAEHKNKFDALSSASLDGLIRSHRVSDAMATSIMNDNANSRSIAKNLRHVAEILTARDIVID